jgi:hypothetical protein
MKKLVKAMKDWQGLQEGEIFGVISTYFYNGEHWYVLLDQNSNKQCWPTCFFNDVEETNND